MATARIAEARLKTFLFNEDGSITIEYTLVLAGMASTIIGTLAVFGDDIVSALSALGWLINYTPPVPTFQNG